jgi:hypothetical protein
MHPQRIALASLVAVTAQLAPRSAAAQPAGAEVALAEVLYQKGRQLMAEGKFAEACPKFAESYRLDAATGTLLNLAACHEAEKKLATAWTEFTEAAASARRDHRDDRVQFAEEHLAAIEPKVSRLAVTVAPNGEIPDLKVQLDGVQVLAAARGVPAPVDPGEHVIEAQAPGRKPWSQRVRIDERSQSITVTVPLLDLEARSQPLAPESTQPAAPTPAAAETQSRPMPASVYIAGGATIALAIGAGVTGIVYMNHLADGTTQPGPTYDANYRLGVANIVFIGGTLAAGGVTAYLYFTRPSKSSSASNVSLGPWLAPGGGGVALGGAL